MRFPTPHWMRAKFHTRCHGCKAVIRRGDLLFIWPRRPVTVFCAKPTCGGEQAAGVKDAVERMDRREQPILF